MRDKQLQVNGRNVHFYEAGEPTQTAIVLLHGYQGDAWIHWEKIMPLLADEYYVIAPDLPAYGGSDALDKLTIVNLMAWVIDLLDALALPSAVMVGSSLGGGLIARLLAVHYPARTPALILINGGVIPAVPPFAKLLARLPLLGNLLYYGLGRLQTGKSELSGLFEDQDFLTESLLKRVQSQRKATADYMRAFTVMKIPDNRTPSLPVLLIWGDEDAITPRVIGEGIQQRIPNSQLELIVETRHLPHVEAPDAVVWQMKAFLQKQL
jgi:3-oxoadipate enol-lactonase/4-carboxymuconolactone decarboxylase